MPGNTHVSNRLSHYQFGFNEAPALCRGIRPDVGECQRRVTMLQ